MLLPPCNERDALLCETCGYPLGGLPIPGDCPECGQTITDSDPAVRTGPLWASRPGPGAWIDVIVDLLRRPKTFFRTMRIDGSNLLPRLFLLTVVCLVGGAWAIAEVALNHHPATWAWARGGAAALMAWLLCYIEVVGVTFFSAWRKWRVPWRLAERIVCYASPGWLPAIALLIGLHFGAIPQLADWLRPLTGPGPLPPQLVLAAYIAVATVAILGFDILVYLGVRQLRFANAPPPPPGSPATPTSPENSESGRLS